MLTKLSQLNSEQQAYFYAHWKCCKYIDPDHDFVKERKHISKLLNPFQLLQENLIKDIDINTLDLDAIKSYRVYNITDEDSVIELLADVYYFVMLRKLMADAYGYRNDAKMAIANDLECITELEGQIDVQSDALDSMYSYASDAGEDGQPLSPNSLYGRRIKQAERHVSELKYDLQYNQHVLSAQKRRYGFWHKTLNKLCEDNFRLYFFDLLFDNKIIR